MNPLVRIITAKSEVEREAARESLAQQNAARPTDREIVLAFLQECTDLQGAPLTLDDNGAIVTRQ